MHLIALTGGIASGKSLAAARLRQLGAVHIDADALAREVVAPGTEALRRIAEEFGADVLQPDGSLDRPALGAIVFNDADRLAVLNDITHPRVRALTSEKIAEAERRNPAAVVVYDVPLLAESAGAHMMTFDTVLVIEAERSERVRRMVEDRGMSEDDAVRRISAQASDAERAAIADVVIVNDGSREDLERRIDQFWAELTSRLSS